MCVCAHTSEYHPVCAACPKTQLYLSSSFCWHFHVTLEFVYVRSREFLPHEVEEQHHKISRHPPNTDTCAGYTSLLVPHCLGGEKGLGNAKQALTFVISRCVFLWGKLRQRREKNRVFKKKSSFVVQESEVFYLESRGSGIGIFLCLKRNLIFWQSFGTFLGTE